MVHVMMVMMVRVMMMMVMVRDDAPSEREPGAGVLRHGVAGEAERKHGGGGKGLDHGRTFLWLVNPTGRRRIRDFRLN